MSESISENQLLVRIAMLAGERPAHVARLSGGDLSAVYSAQMQSGRRLVAKYGPMAVAEADMLAAMARAGVRVPEVVGADKHLVLMQWVDGRGRLGDDAWANLAEQLGLLHASAGAAYGWSADHGFGDVAIANHPHKSWPRFWAENRLLCHAGHIPGPVMDRVERLAAQVDEFLPASPAASLLHGDLWGGNVMVSLDGRTCLIDPACYRGHREVDIAMLTVFNQPPEAFFAGLGMEPGWRERLSVYRLWPWLVHVRLFGEGYLASLDGELARLGF